MGLVLLLPATGVAIAAYVTLYFAGRSEGGMRTFGRVLGGWALLIALVLAVAALSSPFFGGRPFGIAPRMRMHHGMGGPGAMGGGPGAMGGHMMGPQGGPPTAGAPPPAPPPR